jgi:hypothetical protein
MTLFNTGNGEEASLLHDRHEVNFELFCEFLIAL